MENKSYESINFEVQKGLSKPKEFLYSKNQDKIFNSIFIRKKKNSYLDEYKIMSQRKFEENNEVMKILHSNFDTNKKEFYNYEKNHYFVN